jgi:hypothetical protein
MERYTHWGQQIRKFHTVLESCYLLAEVLAQPRRLAARARLAAVSFGISAARTIGSTNNLDL